MVTLLTGSSGMIGKNLKELLPSMLCPTHEELDLTNQDQVKEYLRANNPDKIIHCASNDEDICFYDNLRMFNNLAESHIPMITFCTGREIEDRSYKNGEYVLSKHTTKELALNKYKHIAVVQIWGCFGKYERPIRFFAANIERIKRGLPILVKENKMFSYVYVNDLAIIIREMDIHRRLLKVVAYSQPLLEYAKILSKLTDSRIEVEEENFYHSYIGKNDYNFPYQSLKEAVKELWEQSQ